MSGITLDAGALIALERSDRRVAVVLRRALDRQAPVTIPSTVLAQVVRAPRSQVRLMRLLSSSQCEVVALDHVHAIAVGRLLAASGTSDIGDAHVAVTASSRNQRVLTSDAADIARLDPRLEIEAI